jgi:hypothetical protein
VPSFLFGGLVDDIFSYGVHRAKDLAVLMTTLNEIGKKGWELVSILFQESTGIYFAFVKRKK